MPRLSATETEIGPCPDALDADPRPLIAAFDEVRATTESLVEPLTPEDMVVQSMPDASPARWHLAHSTWFFETFILAQVRPDHPPFHPGFGYLFNSYYNAIGERVARHQRGILSRPTVEEIRQYRRAVDDQIRDVLTTADPDDLNRIAPAITLGLHHEQQHQELLLTDILHAFASNPLRPAYRDDLPESPSSLVNGRTTASPLHWLTYPEGIQEIGLEGSAFGFDNERPRHRVFLEPFQLASRPSTNREYLAFLADDGYQRPEFWLSDGWAKVNAGRWKAPLYWEQREDHWWTMTLAGPRLLNLDEPACHLSYFEADAFARWSGARLPTEAEWEIAAEGAPIEGNLLEIGNLHPTPSPAGTPVHPTALFGDVWEWTRSPYTAYPGFAPPAGAIGEYNGKFMNGQYVLRGGSCVTSQTHIRSTYRNFFPPESRWQFSGLRLARGRY